MTRKEENTMSAAAPARPRRKRAPEPAVEVVDIGPAEASELLASQRHNRKIRTAKIEEFAGAMVRGEWRLSNDALTVDRNGHLLNGQHRLRAVVQSGSTQPFIVMRGVTESTQETMDQGSRRSVADALTLRGDKNVARLGAMARHVFLYERDGSRVRPGTRARRAVRSERVSTSSDSSTARTATCSFRSSRSGRASSRTARFTLSGGS
jgi:hypothetical protein